MQKPKVGKPYQEGVTRIPEGIDIDFSQDGGFFRIVFDSPLDSEVKEIEEGNIKLGLLEEAGIIFFFFKFGELPWMDCPYNVALSKPYDLQELVDENMGYALQVVLVDGMTGIVQAFKLIAFPYEMLKRFKDLVENQRKTPIKDYDVVLNRVYLAYDTDTLVKDAEILNL